MAGDPQGTATLGRALKTEPKCKICSSPHRGEIEDLLAIRSDGASIQLEDGTERRVTEEYIFGIAQERWGFRLNRNNIGTHFSKHFQKGNPAVLKQAHSDAAEELIERIKRGEIPKKTPEELLDLIIGLAFEKAAFDPRSVTLDHGLKAVAEKTKRKQNDAQDELLAALGRSIEKSVDRIPLPEPRPVDGTPPPEIEAEAVEVLP